ncbi:Protein of unknown function [Gryllus bimaculatus]|nr:Protein of unknown function [Gryllus bimaculatus]
MRRVNPTFFELCLPSMRPDVYKLKAVSLLDGYDTLGRPVCYFSADFQPTSITNCQFIQLIVHLLDFLMIDPRMQISGVTILVNLDKQTIGHAKLITIKFLKLMLQIFQSGKSTTSTCPTVPAFVILFSPVRPARLARRGLRTRPPDESEPAQSGGSLAHASTRVKPPPIIKAQSKLTLCIPSSKCNAEH